MFRKILSALFVFTLIIGAGLIWLSDKYVVPVLMYHNIAQNADQRADTVTPKNFEWQMAFLKKQGYHVLTLAELSEGIRQGKKFPRNSVALTFDDGNKNNYTAAFPVLKKYSIPAAFFVVPGWTGREGHLSWDEILVMHQAGMDIQSHSMNHVYLPEATEREQLYEIRESKRVLEVKLKKTIRFFAYPIGGFTDELKGLLKNSGYDAAFTTNRGTDRFEKDVFELNRIRATDRDTNGLVFGAKLSGYYNLFRKLKKAH